MILVNRNFGNHALAQAIGDMFKASTDDNQNIDWVNHTNALASGSSLVASLNNNYRSGYFVPLQDTTARLDSLVKLKENFSKIQNFFLVTEHFLKTLDKVYTKIWNESFTETGIYSASNIATIYNGFVANTSVGENSTINNTYGTSPVNIMLFKKFVDRCITAGILDEADRLQYEDQIFLSDIIKADISTQIDLDNKLLTFTISKPVDIKPDLNGLNGQYLNGKKLFLMMTPYLTNESVIKGREDLWVDNNSPSFTIKDEPFYNIMSIINTATTGENGVSYDYHTPVKRPLAFFKPKTDASKFGRSLPMATHLIWSLGTPADKEIALIEGKPVPDLIFDHLDRISHIDSLVLKIKFDKLQF